MTGNNFANKVQKEGLSGAQKADIQTELMVRRTSKHTPLHGVTHAA